jgi:hypothetical protein
MLHEMCQLNALKITKESGIQGSMQAEVGSRNLSKETISAYGGKQELHKGFLRV